MGGKLAPELDVSDLQKSFAFYVGILGFRLLYERPEEGFAYLDCEGVSLLLEPAEGPGRRFRTASLGYPYGRGVNFQIEVGDIDALHARVLAADLTPLISANPSVDSVTRPMILQGSSCFITRWWQPTPSRVVRLGVLRVQLKRCRRPHPLQGRRWLV